MHGLRNLRVFIPTESWGSNENRFLVALFSIHRFNRIAAWPRGDLPVKPLLQAIYRGGAAGTSDRSRQRDLLGTDRHTILSVSANLDPTLFGQTLQALRCIEFPGWMRIE